jgi:aminoglycoside/choline kinase family phosphotransferase
VEVLFLYSSIDDFVMNNLREYNGRKLLTAETADLNPETLLGAGGKKAEGAERAELDGYFKDIAKELAAAPRNFTHRDYQSRNIMVKNGELIVIDFQDALLGPRVYDLVALLNDSYQEFERAFVEERLAEYAEAAKLPAKDRTKLVHEFDLVTVQRKLKDAGRFVFIDKKKGNSAFLRFVVPTIKKVDAALARLAPHDAEMKELREILQRTLGDELSAPEPHVPAPRK